jgi:nicotinate-nucleotide adenylyltransferase
LKLVLFGGSFDPVHKGHLEVARAAADRFTLDRVLFIPAAHPPHKHGATRAPFADRLRMIELAIAGEPRFEASRLEEFTERSYSIDTIERVRSMRSDSGELFFLIGADAFAEIRTWHRWRDVAGAVRFIVVSRPGATYDIPEGVAVKRIDDVSLFVSSSEIRRALAAGEHPGVLPLGVFDYIRSHQLYR